MRFDLWRGQHKYAFEDVTFLQALQAFVVPFFVINAVILLFANQLGRYLCGWVCPVGVIIRWAEELEYRIGKNKKLYALSLVGIAFVVSTGSMLWWVDLRVYVLGSWRAKLFTATAQIASMAAILFEMHSLRFNFCRSMCPSGVYFAVLGQKSQTGVQLKETAEKSCKDCDLCERVCPIGLDPRDLMSAPGPRPGLYFDDMSHLSQCIRCGDCVTACDFVFNKDQAPGVLELGFDERFMDDVGGDELKTPPRSEKFAV